MDKETLHSSIGVLKYSYDKDYGYKLIVSVDQGIALFYKWLIPLWKVANPQRYPAHISLVRKEIPKNLAAWGKHEGRRIKFSYSPDIQCDSRYWWINAFSTELEEIRVELGLPISSKFTRPPDGYLSTFHITIANSKN